MVDAPFPAVLLPATGWLLTASMNLAVPAETTPRGLERLSFDLDEP